MPGRKTAPWLDAANPDALPRLLDGQQAVISPAQLSVQSGGRTRDALAHAGVSYFYLTEDIATFHEVRSLAGPARAGHIYRPQCGLAPGFVSIVANYLTGCCDTIDSVYMRVGALPQFPTNALRYNLTWSTDGLINEYCNFCQVIHDGRLLEVLPLEGLEHFSLDGIRYEAFNTSGGLGTLCETLEGRVRSLNYKTVRYNGHRDLMEFLIRELRLGERRELLKEILENSIPITLQDVVVIFCTVTGHRDGQLVQISDARKIYQQSIDDEIWSAIQITTAAGVSAVVDLFFTGHLPTQGFVRQEQVNFDQFLANRFGQHYNCPSTHPLPKPLFDTLGADHVD